MKKILFFPLVILVFTLINHPSSKDELSRLNQQLFEAINGGELRQVKTLVEKGIELNVENEEGETPIFLAISKGYKKIETFLLAKGATINSRDRKIAEGKFWQWKGETFYRKAKYQSAINCFRKAYEFNKNYFPMAAAGNLGFIGTSYHLDGIYSKAIDYYKRALKIIIEVENKEVETVLLNNIAVAYVELKQYSKAAEYFLKVIKANPKEFYNVLTNLTDIIERSTFEELGEVLKAAFETYKKPGVQKKSNQVTLAETYLSEARSNQHQGNYQQAINYFEKALESFRETGDNVEEAHTLNELGIVHLSLKDYKQSIDYYTKSLAIFRELEIPVNEMVVLNNLGKVYRLNKQFELSIKCHEQALIISKKIDDKIKVAETLDQIGLTFWKSRQYDKAKNYYERSLAIRHASRDRLGECKSLYKLGNLCLDFKKYSEVKGYFEKALSISQEMDNRLYEAIGLGNIARLYITLYEYESAINYFEKSLKKYQSIKNFSGQEKTLERIAHICIRLGQYAKAANYYEQSLGIIRSNIKNPQREGMLLCNLGQTFFYLGQYEKAQEYLKLSLKIFDEVNYQEGKALTWSYLGDYYASSGQYDKARRYLQKSLDVYREIGNRKREADILNQFGDIYESFMDYEKARVYYEQSLAICYEIDYKEKSAETLNMLGRIYYKKYDRALIYFNKALKISREIKDHSSEARSLYNSSFTYSHSRKYDKAIQNLKQALEILNKIGKKQNQARILSSIGIFNFVIGKKNEAIMQLKNAIKMADNLKQLEIEALARIYLAPIYKNSGKKQEAIDELEKGISILDKTRFKISEKEFKEPWFKKFFDPYRYLFELYYENDDYKNAFKTAEKTKSVVFFKMMSKRYSREILVAQNPEFKKSLDKESVLLRKINEIETQVKKAKGKDLVKLSEEKRRLQEEYDSFQEKLKQKFPLYTEIVHTGSIEKEMIQKLLNMDETYISYYLLDSYAVVFVITKNNFKPLKIEVNKKWIQEKIDAVRKIFSYYTSKIIDYFDNKNKRLPESLAANSKFIDLSKDLYQKIFKPLKPHIKTQKIIVSADEILYSFPLEALIIKVPGIFTWNGKEYPLKKMQISQWKGKIPLFYEFRQLDFLGDKYSISYIPNAASFDILRTSPVKKRKEVNGVIAFADPVFDPKIDNRVKGENVNMRGLIDAELLVKRKATKKWPPERLPETAEEAEIFKKQVGQGEIYTGFEATEENVWMSDLENAKYVLFSTHGILGKEAELEDITEPALVLTLVNNPDEYDGLLGMTEAAGLRLNSDVVILSACNSAGESGKGGEGFAGMARSFLIAGSQAVVASHWQVDARATKMLIENYGKFLKTKGRLEALEEAKKVVKDAVVEYNGKKRKIKVSYAHPYFWSAFVLLGRR